MRQLIVCALVFLLCMGSTSYAETYQVGTASFYGQKHRGKKTASGTVFNPDHMTAAHRSLKFGTILRVTNLENGKVVMVRVTDRGPYIKGRVLDLSHEAARRLDFEEEGLTKVRIEVLS